MDKITDNSRTMKEWKEFLFYITACLFYFGICILLLMWPAKCDADNWLKMILGIGAIVNHIVLAGFIFTHDMDEKKYSDTEESLAKAHEKGKFYPNNQEIKKIYEDEKK